MNHPKSILIIWSLFLFHLVQIPCWHLLLSQFWEILLILSNTTNIITLRYHRPRGFPGNGNDPGSVVMNMPANAEDNRFNPWEGKTPGGGNGNPLQYSWWKNPWTEKPGGYSLWSHKESDTIEHACIPDLSPWIFISICLSVCLSIYLSIGPAFQVYCLYSDSFTRKDIMLSHFSCVWLFGTP